MADDKSGGPDGNSDAGGFDAGYGEAPINPEQLHAHVRKLMQTRESEGKKLWNELNSPYFAAELKPFNDEVVRRTQAAVNGTLASDLDALAGKGQAIGRSAKRVRGSTGESYDAGLRSAMGEARPVARKAAMGHIFSLKRALGTWRRLNQEDQRMMDQLRTEAASDFDRVSGTLPSAPGGIGSYGIGGSMGRAEKLSMLLETTGIPAAFDATTSYDNGWKNIQNVTQLFDGEVTTSTQLIMSAVIDQGDWASPNVCPFEPTSNLSMEKTVRLVFNNHVLERASYHTMPPTVTFRKSEQFTNIVLWYLGWEMDLSSFEMPTGQTLVKLYEEQIRVAILNSCTQMKQLCLFASRHSPTLSQGPVSEDTFVQACKRMADMSNVIFKARSDVAVALTELTDQLRRQGCTASPAEMTFITSSVVKRFVYFNAQNGVYFLDGPLAESTRQIKTATNDAIVANALYAQSWPAGLAGRRDADYAESEVITGLRTFFDGTSHPTFSTSQDGPSNTQFRTSNLSLNVYHFGSDKVHEETQGDAFRNTGVFLSDVEVNRHYSASALAGLSVDENKLVNWALSLGAPGRYFFDRQFKHLNAASQSFSTDLNAMRTLATKAAAAFAPDFIRTPADMRTFVTKVKERFHFRVSDMYGDAHLRVMTACVIRAEKDNQSFDMTPHMLASDGKAGQIVDAFQKKMEQLGRCLMSKKFFDDLLEHNIPICWSVQVDTPNITFKSRPGGVVARGAASQPIGLASYRRNTDTNEQMVTAGFHVHTKANVHTKELIAMQPDILWEEYLRGDSPDGKYLDWNAAKASKHERSRRQDHMRAERCAMAIPPKCTIKPRRDLSDVHGYFSPSLVINARNVVPHYESAPIYSLLLTQLKSVFGLEAPSSMMRHCCYTSEGRLRLRNTHVWENYTEKKGANGTWELCTGGASPIGVLRPGILQQIRGFTDRIPYDTRK